MKNQVSNHPSIGNDDSREVIEGAASRGGRRLVAALCRVGLILSATTDALGDRPLDDPDFLAGYLVRYAS